MFHVQSAIFSDLNMTYVGLPCTLQLLIIIQLHYEIVAVACHTLHDITINNLLVVTVCNVRRLESTAQYLNWRTGKKPDVAC